MKSTLILVGIVLFSVQAMFAQAGKTGLAFLKLPTCGRASAMGEAYSVIGDDPSVMNYNPAALAGVEKNQVVFSHQEWIQDTRSEFLGASSRTGDFTLGFGIHSVSISDIEQRTVPGPAIGTFSARNISIGLSTAYTVTPELSIGVTANYLFEKLLVDEASGIGFNFGAVYLTPWDIKVGAAIDHLGSMNELKNESSILPTTFRVGGAYSYPVESIFGTLTGAVELISVKDEEASHLLVGGEYEYKSLFAVRAGYQTGHETRGFTGGIGVQYDLIKFDYSYAPVSLDFGSAHTFSLGVVF